MINNFYQTWNNKRENKHKKCVERGGLSWPKKINQVTTIKITAIPTKITTM